MAEYICDENEAEHAERGKETREGRHHHIGTRGEDLTGEHEPLEEHALAEGSELSCSTTVVKYTVSEIEMLPTTLLRHDHFRSVNVMQLVLSLNITRQ